MHDDHTFNELVCEMIVSEFTRRMEDLASKFCLNKKDCFQIWDKWKPPKDIIAMNIEELI